MRRDLDSAAAIHPAPFLREMLVVESATCERSLVWMCVRVVRQVPLVRIVSRNGPQPLPNGSSNRFHARASYGASEFPGIDKPRT
jgi:hypothetical protein